MIPQKSGQAFQNFGEAAKFFYEKFSESAPLRFERYLTASSGREIEAVARYCWNVQLSEALIPCLHTAELGLRNAIHQAMCRKYLPKSGLEFPNGQLADDEWWFSMEIKGKPILNDRDFAKVVEAYDKTPKNGKPITPRGVAELSFGFWVELLNSNYDETIVVPMLGSTMKRVQAQSRANRTHGWLRGRFGEIRDLRNRVSHHEPAYHLSNLQVVYDIAWSLSDDITPWLARIIRKRCRFEEVLKGGWKLHDSEIRTKVKLELFEPHKAAPNTSQAF